MSQSSESPYATGVYVKGSDRRSASTQAQAVKLVWDGYTLATAESLSEVSYADLQEQAKAAGIPANQSKLELAAALAAPASGDTPELPKPTTPVPDLRGEPGTSEVGPYPNSAS